MAKGISIERTKIFFIPEVVFGVFVNSDEQTEGAAASQMKVSAAAELPT